METGSFWANYKKHPEGFGGFVVEFNVRLWRLLKPMLVAAVRKTVLCI